jgi:hypothetical protein
MLRMLFGEERRKADGPLAEAFERMEEHIALVQKRILTSGDGDHKLRTYEIWTKGLIASLDELEQSQYAARRYASKVTRTNPEKMPEEELLDYRRHIYYDKNAFIRIFSVLDKLGTFMNDVFHLETEKMKVNFSYFTVLRGMRQRGLHPALGIELDRLKEAYKEPLALLRKRRNTETHYMNSEMQDDLVQSHQSYGGEIRIENIQKQLSDLDLGCRMVIESLRQTFRYANLQMSNKA